MDRSSHPKIVTIEIVKSTRLELNKDFRGLVFLYYGWGGRFILISKIVIINKIWEEILSKIFRAGF